MTELNAYAYSDGDVDTNRSGNPTLSSLVEERFSRRQTLYSGFAATAAVAITLPSANAIESGDFGFAYSLKRVLAFLLDLGLVGGLCIAAFGWTLWRQKIPAESLLSPEMALLFFSFLAVFSWSMIVAQEMAFGTTVGKRLFGLILIGSPAAIFLRAFFFLPSVGFCGIGLLWAAFDSQRRCWHDLASEVQPTEVAEL